MRFKPLEKNNLPSPTSYEKNDLKLSSRLASPNLTFAKDQKQKSFVETQIKAKNFVPGPAAYNPDRGFKIITSGLSRSYRWLNYYYLFYNKFNL